MPVLFVFDETLRLPASDQWDIPADEGVWLFPLTGLGGFIEEIAGSLRRHGCRLNRVETASLVAAAADALKKPFVQFVAELPDRVKVNGEGLREHFAVDPHASAWWFSLVAEKSPYKSKSYLRLAQLDAIISLVKEHSISQIRYGAESLVLSRSLKHFARKNHLTFQRSSRGRTRLITWLREDHFLSEFRRWVLLGGSLINLWRLQWKMKSLPSVKSRPSINTPLALLTFFPLLNEDQARAGVFQNRFFEPLQEALRKVGKTISWIAVPVAQSALPLSNALRYARQFLERGERMIFLPEAASLPAQIYAFFVNWKMGRRFRRIQGQVRNAYEWRGYSFFDLFEEEWVDSFGGRSGFEGILYYQIFKKILSKIQPAHLLYPCEMHAMEKCLIQARDAVRPDLCLIAYQPTTVSPLLLNYFNDSSEAAGRLSPYPMPRPDRLVCCGKSPLRHFIDCGWPVERLFLGEAIRFHPLRQALSEKHPKSGSVVLVAFSISAAEAIASLSMVLEAFSGWGRGEIWIKPHPFLNIQKVLQSMHKTLSFPFILKEGAIEPLLAQAAVVIVGESSVCVQALAYGCEVVTINHPGWLNMSPLRALPGPLMKTATYPAELRDAVEVSLADRRNNEHGNLHPTRDSVVRDFFELDWEIPSRLMECLESK